MWVDSDGRGGFKHTVGKGSQLIIVHAGGEAGWISKADLVFRAKSKDVEHFLEWFKNQLCPHIPAGSLIVLENASYHNTQIKRIRVVGRLRCRHGHGIAFEGRDLKIKNYRCKANKAV